MVGAYLLPRGLEMLFVRLGFLLLGPAGLLVAVLAPKTSREGEMENLAADGRIDRQTAACPHCGRVNSVRTRVCPRCDQAMAPARNQPAPADRQGMEEAAATPVVTPIVAATSVDSETTACPQCGRHNSVHARVCPRCEMKLSPAE